MRALTLLLGAAALTTLAAEPAAAFAYRTCNGVPIKWQTNGPTLRASDTSFPAGYWRDGLQKAVDRTNQNPSPFFFGLVSDTGGLNLNNNENEVWGSTDPNLLQGAPAIAYTRTTCSVVGSTTVARIDESDVLFNYNAPFQWTADELKSSIIRYTGTLRQLQATAIHEFGHAAGLQHVNTEYNIMGSDFEHIWANGSTARGYLGEDASDATVFLYGLWAAAYEDLGVSHWKYFGASGEYSTHTRTQVFSAAGAVLPTVLVNGEVGYRVSRNQTVQVEFTFENNGKTTQTVNAGYYVSTNDLISRTDRLRATATGFGLGRGDVLTYRANVKIPNNLVSGQNYWLGVVIDKDNAVADNIPSNNASYIPIRVQ